MIGARLGSYEITAKLGEGGMGIVYRARDPRLGREVAVKVLSAEVAGDPERLRRFEVEARAASALNHPNILTVHDIGSSEGAAYLVTEFLEGGSLRELLRGAPLQPSRAREIAAQVARGLAATHRKGIVHRDLKPENLFVTSDGTVKILDFGLARVERPELAAPDVEDGSTLLETSAGTVLGTVGYMAPEQVRGEHADARSDIFSLGVVLHEMLTGANPFRRQSVVESLHAILKEEPQDLSMSGAGSALEPIVRRCLEKEPERRFQSASDLAFALESLPGAQSAAPRGRAAAGGHRRLRNGVFALVAVAFAAVAFLVARSRSGAPTTSARAPIRSLAVLPFASLSAELEDEYFSDGMTDVLTTELARFSGLTVISRNSTVRFKGSSLSAAAIADELGVQALISGSVLRAGERVRISAQLAEAETDRVVWAENFERAVRDVLSLQGEVAREIADAIALRLSPSEEDLLGTVRTVDPRALDEYLKGRSLWTRRTEEAVRAALAHFRAAVEAAPGFALGHAGIADAYIILAAYDWMEPRQALPLAVAAVEQAQTLDPAAGEPHASRGDLAIHYDRDLALARRELDRALELSPGYATAHHWRGEASLYGGRPEEAVGFLQRAIELDPLATAAQTQLALAYEALGQLEEAERGYRRAHDLSPGYSWPAGALVRIDLARGRTADALAAAGRAVEADPSATNLATLGVSLAWVGRTDEARAVLARLTELGRQRWISPYELARVEAALGERDAALAHLRDAVEARVFRVQALSVVPELEFRRFADDPEFERIRNEMWQQR